MPSPETGKSMSSSSPTPSIPASLTRSCWGCSCHRYAMWVAWAQVTIMVSWSFRVGGGASRDWLVWLASRLSERTISNDVRDLFLVDGDYLAANGIYYANTPYAVSDPTATTTIQLIFQTVRAASMAEAVVRRGEWRRGLSSTPDVRDLTIGIVGMGTIGRVRRILLIPPPLLILLTERLSSAARSPEAGRVRLPDHLP